MIMRMKKTTIDENTEKYEEILADQIAFFAAIFFILAVGVFILVWAFS